MAQRPVTPIKHFDVGEPGPHESSKNTYTDTYLIATLQALREDLGRAPTVLDVRNLAKVLPDVSTYEERFGTWIGALTAAGIEGSHNRSDETILRQLASLAIRLGGRAPTKREVDADPSVASSGLYCNRFGSFSLAVRRALDLAREIQGDTCGQ